jgi:restriction endonuclease
VVASESDEDFGSALQKNIRESRSVPPRVADKAYFTGKTLVPSGGDNEVTADRATGLDFHLVQNGGIDKKRKSFFIPTPVGNYNPDWAIAFHDGKVKHIYFIAETKGSMSTMDLRAIEKSKIACARKFFARITSDQVRYDVVDRYGKLMALVK